MPRRTPPKTDRGRRRSADIVTGRFASTRRGFGFVSWDRGQDIYVAAGRTGGAVDGDLVEVRLSARRRSKGRREGEVVRVVERARRTLVGRYERKGRVGRVVPLDRRMVFDVLVDRRHDPADTRPGDIVEVEVLRWPDRDHAAQGRVVEVLGAEDDPSIDVEVIIREHGLRTAFPAGALAEAEAAPGEVGPSDAAGRVDLRGLFTVTIDGEDAKDFDDAISLARTSDGWELTTHIADVSHYVGLESDLFAEAAERATSVYLVDRVLPMLPEPLSNGICSLRPGVDRLAVSVQMRVDRAGHVTSHEVRPSVIRSDHRLTYEAVDEWFATSSYPSAELADLLGAFRDLMRVLEARRIDRGGLDFDTVEAKVRLAPDGVTPQEVEVRRRTTATQLIEEAMILTNEVIAERMHAVGAPMVYRVHDEPDADSLDQLSALIDELGYPASAIGSASAATFQRIIQFARGRPEELLLNRLLLRTMKQARYKAVLAPHFGLASPCYCHFTSPIRRFPDFLVHHLLKAELGGVGPGHAAHGGAGPGPSGSVGAGPGEASLGEGGKGDHRARAAHRELVDELPGHAEHASLMEREADDAERESVEVKVCELMRGEIGEVFEGVVSGVTTFGLFVELENTAEGLVHVSDLDDDHYDLEAERFQLVGRHTGRRIRMGQTLKVRLVNVSVSERRLDLVPA